MSANEWECPRCGLIGDGVRSPDPDRCLHCCRIDAADDLYEALAEIVGRRESACRAAGGNPDGSDGRYARARAALAKARGER
jgi:hypothetical protein